MHDMIIRILTFEDGTVRNLPSLSKVIERMTIDHALTLLENLI